MEKTKVLTIKTIILVASFTLMSFPSYASLIAHYKADGDATDSVGTNNGILNNGASFAAGSRGQAFDFDGINDSISIADNELLNVASAITIAAWVRPESEGSTDGTTGILWKGNSIGNLSGQSYAFLQSGSGVTFRLGEGSTLFQTQYINLSLNTFTHIAGTFDGSVMNLYVNGVLATTSINVPNSINNSSNDLLIGGSTLNPSFGGDPTRFYFDGQIDDVKIYGNALSSVEIQSLATIPVPAAVCLFGSGLIGLIGMRNNRRLSKINF